MKIQEAFDELQKQFKTFENGEDWKRFLAFSAQFRQYSLCNTVLIFSQCPQASFVAGFGKWKTLNRHVKKGEKGIKIFAPITKKVQDEKSQNPEKYQSRIVGYQLVYVYDISQTDGADVPTSILHTGLKNIEGAEQKLGMILEHVKDVVEVSTTVLPEGHHGLYNIAKKEIKINANDTALQNVKTLFHELAHHYHETQYLEGETEEQKEFIAESAAFIACAAIGIDASEYSIPYLKNWADDYSLFSKMRAKIEKIAKMLLPLAEETKAA